MSDPRSILLVNIASNAALPTSLVATLLPKEPQKVTIVEDNILKQTLNSQYINLSERERIAKAVLEGKDVPIPTSGKVLYQPHKKLENKAPVSTRHSSKLNFLEVVSVPAEIKEVNMQQDMMKYKTHRDPRVKGYVWANNYCQEVPEVYNVTRNSDVQAHIETATKVMSIIKAQETCKR
jgi:hypothetical protein